MPDQNPIEVNSGLADSAASAGTYGAAAKTLIVEIDSKGIVQSIQQVDSAIAASQIASGVLAKARGGLGVNASAMTWPALFASRVQLFPFGGSVPQFIASTGSALPVYLESDPTLALRSMWPRSHGQAARFEVQLSQAVGVDEEFEAAVYGAVYGGSGLISAATPTILDNGALMTLTFAAGDTATKTISSFLPALVGDQLITHALIGVTPLGSSYYSGSLTLNLHSAP